MILFSPFTWESSIENQIIFNFFKGFSIFTLEGINYNCEKMVLTIEWFLIFFFSLHFYFLKATIWLWNLSLQSVNSMTSVAYVCELRLELLEYNNSYNLMPFDDRKNVVGMIVFSSEAWNKMFQVWRVRILMGYGPLLIKMMIHINWRFLWIL